MILERRDILFDYPTALEIIRESGTPYARMPELQDYYTLKEAHHFGAMHRSRDLTNRVQRLQADNSLSGQVSNRWDDIDIFFILIGRDYKEVLSFFKEPELVDIFSNGCIKRGLRMPRDAIKNVLNDDLMIGLRIMPSNGGQSTNGLSLELE